MLDLCLLGTGGMTPMPKRWLTSLMLRCEGSDVLVDCGEGTQIAMKEVGWSPKSIDIMCFTHMHGDHISGLPGMLLNMANADRTDPVIMIGPKGLYNVTKSLCCIAPGLPFELRFIELDQATEEYKLGPYVISCYKVSHSVPCYGYSFTVPRKGRFDAEKAKELGIPLAYWSRLQKGEVITDMDLKKTFRPEMVMGPDRKGLKVTYATDSRPTDSIVRAAADADVFICEGMYGEPGSEGKAREYRHMTMQEAAAMAARAEPNPKELIFTHYSPSMIWPKDYIEDVRSIFPASFCGKDGLMKTLDYIEEE